MTLAERIEVKSEPEPNSGCLLWIGATIGGYAVYAVRGKFFRVIRELCSPIPQGSEPDHLCRVTRCVNRAHLEVVTKRENILRGAGPTAQNARKTKCPRGHEYDRINPRGSRTCSVCDRTRNREAYRAKRGLALSHTWRKYGR